MIHVIQEGMTILNTTQGRIIENREKINDIIDVIHNVSHKLVTVSTTVGVHGYTWIQSPWLSDCGSQGHASYSRRLLGTITTKIKYVIYGSFITKRD